MFVAGKLGDEVDKEPPVPAKLLPADIHAASTSHQRKAMALAVKHLLKASLDAKHQHYLAKNAVIVLAWEIVAVFNKLDQGGMISYDRCIAHAARYFTT